MAQLDSTEVYGDLTVNGKVKGEIEIDETVITYLKSIGWTEPTDD